MRILLLGFMSAGKSTLGPVLAREAGLPFADLDAEIEGKAGFSVAEIFRAEGEAGFRRRESEALARRMAGDDFVLATGGGIVEPEANHALLRAGFGVYLYWSWELLRRRLAEAAPGTRPLRDAGEAEWERRWRRRDPLYRALSRLRLAMVPAAGDAAEAILLAQARQVLAAAGGAGP